VVGCPRNIALSNGGDAAGGAHGEVGGIIDETADLDQVEEDCRVNGARPGSVVVRIGDSFQNFRGELKPWAMKGRNIAPMSEDNEIFPSAPANKRVYT
jgi:hypothetical protein